MKSLNFLSLSWNIERFSTSKYKLKSFLHDHDPSFVFLSEPMMFQCDLAQEMNLFQGKYCAALSLEDLFDHELPLDKRSAKGGAMIMWKVCLNQFLTPLDPPSSRQT